MKRSILWLLAVAPLAGCQLIGNPGEVAGSLTDIDGNPVRGANIFIDNLSAGLSSPNGTFTIREVSPGTHTVKAELRIGSTDYRGRNHVVVFAEQRTTSVGLVMGPVSQLATLHGRVTDGVATPLEGVRVFAGGPLNSWMAVTDSNGNYTIDDLIGGFTYTVTASGRGYENDTDTDSAVAGQNHSKNFVLAYSSGQSQNGINNLTATAWTSPVDPDLRANNGAIERIKQLVDPNRREKMSRAFHAQGPGITDHVEIDLSWSYKESTELLGYGIYRGTNTTGALQPLDVLRDPLASFFADISDALNINVRYYYQVSRLNTDYPNGGSESPLSADTSGIALGDLNLIAPFFAPQPNLRWSPLFNATSYTAYVFSYYPDFQAVPIWVSAPTASTSVVVNTALTSGQRYYYVVVASGFSGDSFSISPIDSFLAP